MTRRYAIVCDEPQCPNYIGIHPAWDLSVGQEMADSLGWQTLGDPQQHFCPEHRRGS